MLAFLIIGGDIAGRVVCVCFPDPSSSEFALMMGGGGTNQRCCFGLPRICTMGPMVR